MIIIFFRHSFACFVSTSAQNELPSAGSVYCFTVMASLSLCHLLIYSSSCPSNFSFMSQHNHKFSSRLPIFFYNNTEDRETLKRGIEMEWNIKIIYYRTPRIHNNTWNSTSITHAHFVPPFRFEDVWLCVGKSGKMSERWGFTYKNYHIPPPMTFCAAIVRILTHLFSQRDRDNCDAFTSEHPAFASHSYSLFPAAVACFCLGL